MSSVDDRIVNMQMNSKSFESGVTRTMSLLDRLKAALNFGNKNGLTDLQGAANRFNLNGLTNAAAGVGTKFSAMSVAAIAAIGSIAVKAVSVGAQVVKSFTFQPIMDGFREYETQLNSVQTILANTKESGATLKDVNATLNELNHYADKTIYNFGEMARNIGTFTAAGVELKTATASIKGIANLAALSGSNSQQASTAMYQLSQAISAGRVSLQDWNSVVNAGMGGTVFQRALAQNAERIGTLDKGAVKLKGSMKNVSIEGKSFRESITAKPGEESWLTSEVLTSTLEQFTGDLTVAQLKAMGFSDAMAQSIHDQGLAAMNAATEVKTFSQLIGSLQEAAGSGWAQTWQIIIGDFEEAKTLWTNVNNIVGTFLDNSSKARNKMLQDWKDLGGRTKLIEGINNVFNALVSIVKPISQAFREIFPATTGKQLFAMTTAFLSFTKQLKIGAETANNLKRTFAGVFAVFGIGWSAIKAILGVLGDLFGLVASGSGGFLEVTASIGDWLVALDKAIKKGDVFNKFFQNLGAFLKVPIALLKQLGLALADMFASVKANGLSGLDGALGRLGDRLKPLGGIAKQAGGIWSWLIGVLEKAGQIFAPLGKAIGTALTGIGDAIAKAFKAGNFNSVYDALNTGLLTGIVLLVKKFLDDGLKIDLGGGLGASIKETFGALTETLSAMQAQIQAKTLLTIAGAIGILTVSIVALSLIDSAALTKSLTALGVAFGQLMGAMAILTKIAGAGGFTKIPVIAAGMVILAGAILILTAAVKNLSGLSWEDLLKGLLGVGVLLAMIATVANTLQKSSGPILRIGIAMIPLAVGLLLLSKAMESMAGMSYAEIAKGLIAIGGALLVMGAGMKFMSGSVAGAAAMLIAAAAINVMVPALQAMGQLKWQEIGKIMVTLFGALLLLAAGMYAMTASLPGAAALLVAAAAIAILTPALAAMGELPWQSIGKIMVTLFGTLLLLAAGLTAMVAALPGAAALLVAASALAILAPVLVLLGTLTWEMIGKGLVAIAGAILAIGLASVVLAPAVPLILGLAASFLLLGTGIALLGTGLLAIASAFTIFVAAGTAGIAVLTGMINLIPLFMAKFAEGIGTFAVTIVQQSAKVTAAIVSLIGSLLDAIIQLTPKVAKTFLVLIINGIAVISQAAPRIAAAGVTLMLALINALTGKMGALVAAAGRLIVAFLTKLQGQVPKIAKVGTDLIIKLMAAIQASQGRLIDAGARMIIDFINKLASSIRAHQGEMRTAGRNLASAIVSGMVGGMSASRVITKAVDVARSALSAAKSALGINSPSRKFAWVGDMITRGWAGGMNARTVIGAVTGIGSDAISAAATAMSKVSDAFDLNADLRPTITPVIDLSQITKDAAQMSKVISSQKVTPEVSYTAASDISTTRLTQAADSQLVVAQAPTEIKFEQNNYSPTALSPVDIYRNTRNQLSLAKGALGIS